MALGSTAKQSVREQLEMQFDTYLAQVVSYLKDSYRELGFSPELVEEIAATVIVRVSHSNAEPENLEQALFTSADDVVRARRPRLSQQKLVDRMNGSTRSDLPPSLPSLRLIQRLSRVPASNADDVSMTEALETLGRLSLPKPPIDLQASLNTNDLSGPKELEGTSIPSGQIPSLKHEPRFRPVIPSYEDSLDEIVGFREKAKAAEPGDLERELDGQLTNAASLPKIRFLERENEDTSNDDPADQAPVAMREPSIFAINETAESSKRLLELPKQAFEGARSAAESTMAAVHLEHSVSAPPPSASSIPPTKESMMPTALVASMNVGDQEHVAAGEHEAVGDLTVGRASSKQPPNDAQAQSTVVKPESKRRKGATQVQAPTTTEPNPKFEARHKVRTVPKTKARTSATKSRADVAAEAAVQSYGILPDELAMLAMVGFPDNPRRAARLCVAALADELGVSAADGFESRSEAVAEVLQDLSQALASSGRVDAHAALQWQRAARQATLRAFLTR